MGSQAQHKMRSRSSWSWSRPTCHIYAYNRELTRQTTASSATAEAESSRRSLRASSVVGESDFASSASAAAKSVSMAASKTTSVQEKTTTSVEKKSVSREQILSAQEKSLEYGRSSGSKALRRAEIHAVNSGKDPRHVFVPRIHTNTDDICKVVADLHISPFEGKEITSAKAASQQGRLKVERMEKELSKVTSSAMAYKSMYQKSASQMAAEAMSACEAEASSSKKTRKTIVESSTKRVAAA